ncbi:MAG: PHP domain-containing protein [Acidimicrobiales bacterium]
MIDLHTHSSVSDGSDPPARLAELAAAAGCGAVALTDHDRTDGVAAARARGRQVGVDVVSGCELSCQTGNGTMHLLAYFVEPGQEPLHTELGRLQSSRDDRNRRMADRLAEIGLPVTLEEMEAESAGAGVGRPHVATVLVAKGVVGSVQEAFDRYLAKGRPGYVGKEGLAPARAVAVVRASGGVAVLAHPLTNGSDRAALDRLVAGLAADGLVGLESQYGRYAPAERAELASLAARHGLVATGGSDYHGTYKPDLAVGTGRGDLCVDDHVLVELAARRP